MYTMIYIYDIHVPFYASAPTLQYTDPADKVTNHVLQLSTKY